MPKEQITDLIAKGELQKGDVQYLDAFIPLLQRKLLYESSTPEDEITGYRYLRSLTDHPDKTVQTATVDALDQRWKKVGFYKLRPKIKDFHLFEESGRAYFREMGSSALTSGSGVGEESKVAIIELAKQKDPVTIKQFEDSLTPLIGLGKNFPQIIEELKRLHVLTDEAQYTPVVESVHARIKMTEAAFNVLAPHLSVLEAISYPEQRITEDNKQQALAVEKEIDKIFSRASSFWDSERRGLLMPQERNFHLPMITMLEYILERDDFKNPRGIIYFIDQDKIYQLSRYIDPGNTPPIKESIAVEIHKLQKNHNTLLINFWGHRVGMEKKLGSLDVHRNSRFGNYIEATGILKPKLPRGLEEVSVVNVSARQMAVEWEDVSRKGKGITVQSAYQKLHKGPTLKRAGGERTYYIVDEPEGIAVTASRISKYSRTRKRAKKDNWTNLVIPHPRTSQKDICFDKNGDLIEVQHPKGKYTVGYKKTKEEVEVTFMGKGWERTLNIPIGIHPVEITQAMGQQLDEITQNMTDKREIILQQIANIKRMGLVEHVYYNHFGVLPTILSSDFFENKEYYQQLIGIDEELAKLDADTTYCAKYYMAALREMCRSGPIDKEVAKLLETRVKDPRQEFREIMKKYGINISERLLTLTEEVFIPEEYRNILS